MVGQFKKADLHRQIKILQFLTPAGIQKFLTELFINKPTARDFLTCYSCLYYSFMVAVTITVTISLPSFTKDGVSSIKQKK